jgi:hypothetical protein
MIKAPWTAEQVVKLNEFQNAGYVHPFTCPNRDEGHGEFNGDKGALVATVRGWICPFCDYAQDWAHDGMDKGAPPEHPADIAAWGKLFDKETPGSE